MKTTSNSRINREEQVQVVIRLKPDDNPHRSHKCVYLSQNQNELVVQAGNKKEIFLFDSIAPQQSSQIEIYEMIGQQAVQASFDGYNCCIFAYGQTGAGKTYSVMGTVSDLAEDYLAESRGLLPRIIEDIFCQIKNHESKKCNITCSYMQIYNEQIFDLLSEDKRIHPIREDFKRGVFVQGLIQRKVYSYEEGIDMVLQGQKTRRISSTSMNNQSSRSHAIFTITIQSQVLQDQVFKMTRSKLNIIDLAGSERIKHTNVQGERLKQGCNINKSLHVLGNVINSLVESTKKKKHIPFRDSKLTHFLKDSLGGNSITKLLANVHCGKNYFGDTLSTLMFAKRAKSLKMKVQVNESVIENFDSLRKQVKRLRQELAQAKYFKDETQRTQRPSFQSYLDSNIVEKNTQFINQTVNGDALKTFEENQLHYKALIEIYEEHAANCDFYNVNSKKKPIIMVNEWKKIQKKNIILTSLLRKMPLLSKIYRQNLQIKRQLAKFESSANSALNQIPKACQQQSSSHLIQPLQTKLNQIITYYEQLISQLKGKFEQCIDTLSKQYNEFQYESKMKQKRLKDYIRKQGFELGIQELKNENEYLHLNILNLQNEISMIQENQLKMIKNRCINNYDQYQANNDYEEKGNSIEEEELYEYYRNAIQNIKREALKQSEIVRNELQRMQATIEGKDQEIRKLSQELKRYKQRSRSKKISPLSKRSNLIQRSSSICNIDKSKVYIMDVSNHVELPRVSFDRSVIALTTQKVQALDQYTNKVQPKIMIEPISLQLSTLKEQNLQKDSQIVRLKGDVKKYIQKNALIQNQLGKSIDDILNEYRRTCQKAISKNIKNISKYKEQDPMSLKYDKLQDLVNKQKKTFPCSDNRTSYKETRGRKQQPTHLKSNTNAMKKSMVSLIK